MDGPLPETLVAPDFSIIDLRFSFLDHRPGNPCYQIIQEFLLEFRPQKQPTLCLGSNVLFEKTLGM